MTSAPRDVNALAASLRAQEDDASLYAGMLLNTLSSALPARMLTVEREGGVRLVRRRPSAITAVTIAVNDRRFELRRAKTGGVPSATVQHIVRGIVLSSDVLPLTQWTEALARALTDASSRDSGVAAAIDALVARSGL